VTRLRVRAAIAPLHKEPAVSSPQVSQRVAGQLVMVLAERGDWRRVSGDDAYEGWLHRGYLAPGLEPDRPGDLISGGCTVASIDGAPRPLPLGALVFPDEHVVEGRAVTRAEIPSIWPREASAVAHSAEVLFSGASYQWGGVTPWGADCSGFVQTVYGLHGVSLPRDAWQQAESGVSVSGPPFDPADLVFFSERDDGRITHVGVALGGERMAHVALGRGGFAIESLGRSDDPYVSQLRDRLRVVRRLV
jgi:gamma-D-glutamyl-L-lysine dipeptidyl-peptidase